MASKITRLKDNNGNIIYPLTSLDAVYYSDSQTAKQYIDSKAGSSYTLPAATASTLGGVKIGSNITNSSGTISISKANVTSALGYTPPTTNTTYNDMTGATASAAGAHGLVPAPTAGANTKFLRGDGTWQAVATSSGDTTWKTAKTAGQFYKADDAPSSTTVGKYDGYFYATRVYNAVYNDYAELFPCVKPVSVGHLAYATEEGAVCAGKPKTAIGIVSDCYGHLLGGNGDPDDENFVPIAVAGRVPLEIKGNIEIGDMVQATNNGLGKKAYKFTNRNKIVGKIVGPDPKGRNNYMEVLVGGM